MKTDSPSSPSQDYDQAQTFLEALGGGPGQIFTFQTFDDDHDRDKARRASTRPSGRARGSPYASILHGTIEAAWKRLVMLNSNGAGIFVTVSKTDGKGRKFENVYNVPNAIRAVWCEDDDTGPKRDNWPIQPHIAVESSPGKFHYYWLVDGMDHSQFQAVMRHMVRVHGSDPNAMDITRVLRLPGTLHQKRNKEKGQNGTPFLVHLVDDPLDSAPYEPHEVIAALGADWEEKKAEPAAQEKPKKIGRADVNMSSLRSALLAIPCDDRNDWLRVGMALQSAGFPGARELWDSWSEKSPKFDPVDQQRTWESFRRTNGPLVSIGTVYELAKHHGWVPPSRLGAAPDTTTRDWRESLLFSASNQLIDCPANIMMILRSHPRWNGALRFDSLAGAVIKTDACPLGAGEWTDQDDIEVLRWLALDMRLGVRNLAAIGTVVETVARGDTFNPFADYLASLPPWDGQPWLQSCFSSAFGIRSSDYIEALGYCLFGAIVWRTLAPGSPAPQTVVVRGNEQVGKSWFSRIIGGRWHKTILMSMEGKDIYSALQGCIVGELADLDTLGRTGERRIKAFMTAITDTWRPQYARREVRHNRTVTFIGTANPDAPLPDGEAQRWLPVEIGSSRLRAEVLERSRDALFAHAIALFQKGEKPWLPDRLRPEADEEREKCQADDPWKQSLMRILVGRDRVCMADLMGEGGLNIPTAQQTKSASTRIGLIMSQISGWERKQLQFDGVRGYFYVRSRKK